MDIKEEQILGDSVTEHWYYVAKGRALRTLLPRVRVEEILDVGAGSGVFSRQLLEAKVCQRAICVDPGYADERIERRGGGELRFVRGIDSASQKLILMIDVIEHVDDDIALIRSYIGAMERDGLVVIVAPAFQSLWSGHDVFLGHRRRYTLRGLEDVVRAAGLDVVRSRYFFGLLFPIVAAMRLFDRLRIRSGRGKPASMLRKYPWFLNYLLILIHDIERLTLFRFNRLIGLSVFCVARGRSMHRSR